MAFQKAEHMDHTVPSTDDSAQDSAVVTISTFANERDTKPKPRQLTVDALFAEMTDHRTAVDKKGGRLWSPIVFDGARKGKYAVQVSLLVFDIDDGTSPIEVITWLNGLHAAVASTHKSTPDAWRLRVMVELDQPIPAAEYRQVWDNAVAFLLRGHVDGATYDLARMFYLPTHKPDVAPFAQILQGGALDWRSLPVTDSSPKTRMILGLEDIAGLDAGDERRRSVGLLRSFADAIAHATHGERHAMILAKARAAGGLRAYLDYDEIVASLLQAAVACGEVDQYGEDDVRRAIDDGISYGIEEPWTPSQLGDAPVARIRGHQSDISEDDEDQVAMYRVPDFPEDVLPPGLLALCKESSLPTSLVAGAGLAAMAIAIGGDAELAVHVTHSVRATVFVPIIGPRSVGKSPTIDLVMRPLETRQDAARSRYQLELQEWLALDQQARKGHPRPKDPRIYAGDATGAAWVRDLERRHDVGRVLHEMSQTLGKTTGGRDRAALIDAGLLLQLWSGNSVSYTRVGNGQHGGNEVDLYVPRPTVTILGDLQTKYHALLGGDDDGMRPRWLPHLWTERWKGKLRHPSIEAVQAWDDLIHTLVKRREGLERVGMHMHRTWTLDDDARVYFDQRVMNWSKRLGQQAPESYLAGLSKADNNFLRIALVLAEAEAPDLRRTVVSRGILERAARWVEYCLEVWLALGSYEHLSLSRQQEKLDPAVDLLRTYIEEAGEVDPTDGRKFVTAARILDHHIARVRDRRTRDDLTKAYGAVHPGCVVVRQGHGKGRDVTCVYAPRRREFLADLADLGPSGVADLGTSDADLVADLADLGAKSANVESDRPEISPENDPIEPEQKIEVPSRAPARESPGNPGPTRVSAGARARNASAEKILASAHARVSTHSRFAEILETIAKLEVVGMDTETTTLHPQQGGRIRLIQLATPDQVYVCDLDAIDDWRVPFDTFLRDRDGPRLVGQEVVFDLGWLKGMGLPMPRWQRLFDTRLAARLVERRGQPGFKYDLKTLAKRYLDVDLPKDLQASDWSGELSEAQIQYAADDAAVVLMLHDKLVPELDELEAWDVFRLEHRVLPSFVWMRENGAPVDVPLLTMRASEAASLRDTKLAELHALAGTVQENRPPNGLRKKDPPREPSEMNWSSTPQLRERLQLESTRKQYLLQLDPMPPVVEALLAWRGATRLAAYGDQLLHNALIGDRVYGSFDSLGAATGRTSCRVPNLQQMNRGRHYREAIAAGPGMTLVKVDYSALQMRIAADISGDQALIDLFNAGGDPHTLTAETILGTADARQAAKAINFGLLFGASAATLRISALVGYGVRMTLAEAAEYRAAFFALYPGLLAWHNRFEHKRNAPINVPDPSGSGRVRRQVIGFNERINSPVQMVEAHGMKRAMIMLYARRAEHPDAKLVLSVHDELVMTSPIDQAQDVGPWLAGIAHDAMQPLLERVPVGDIEVTIWPRWWKPKDEVTSDTLDSLVTVLDGEDDDVGE